ncbi:hypothetical protein LWI28_005232 [Acer negundo]|uniref:Uncharacterized protein n=1 Tax=Acer negundo TaxID=4023 RepID=A0AAD5J3Q5_ACENE|nr:hypothetical protein LWI28_005232 [Acer negundo]
MEKKVKKSQPLEEELVRKDIVLKISKVKECDLILELDQAEHTTKEIQGINANEGRKVESWSGSKEMDCTEGKLFDFQSLKGGNVNRINVVGPEFYINQKVVKEGPNSKVGFRFVGPYYKTKSDSQLGLEPSNCNGLGDGLVNY